MVELLECSKRLKAQLQQQEHLEHIRATLEAPLLTSQQQQQQQGGEMYSPSKPHQSSRSNSRGCLEQKMCQRSMGGCSSSSSSRGCLQEQGSSKHAGGSYERFKKPQRLRSPVQAARSGDA